MSRIVVTNFYPVYPVEHGGQRRIFFLARELSKDHKVILVTLSRGDQLKYLSLGQRLTEIQVPAGDAYNRLDREMAAVASMAGDVAYAMGWQDCQLYQGVLREQILRCDLVVSEHPYSIWAIDAVNGPRRRVPMIYNSQNVEVKQKEPVLKGRADLLGIVRSTERAALEKSDAVIACSDVDRSQFASEYGVPLDKITIIGNGVDCASVPSISPQLRDAFRAQLRLDDRLTAIFGGSLHHPNLAAIDVILDMAQKLPGIVFLIVGSICRCRALSGAVPQNVFPLGTLLENEKWLAFKVSDIALNPMTHGSGSNIKVFEYAAAGLPILSTSFGARGTGLEPGRHYIEAELDDFPTRLAEWQQAETQEPSEIGRATKDFVTTHSDWSVIGESYRKLVASVLEQSASPGPRDIVPEM